ncbi:unnamed protein product [Vicia faba]|uniref:Uncharacterized protein n=1 Tax=Vicia faba TaxID=3906 RepID=A0AAV0ZP54_VICFA|nr:unnamed protein product [Vicia faba]
MVASSSTAVNVLDAININKDQRPQNADKPTHVPRSLFVSVKELEVCCELMIDLPNLRDNGFDLEEEIQTQGWNMFFNRLYGPVYDVLVKEFWIHAHPIPTRIVSSVLGVTLVITEDHVRKLLGLTEKIGFYKAPAGGL